MIKFLYFPYSSFPWRSTCTSMQIRLSKFPWTPWKMPNMFMKPERFFVKSCRHWKKTELAFRSMAGRYEVRVGQSVTIIRTIICAFLYRPSDSSSEGWFISHHFNESVILLLLILKPQSALSSWKLLISAIVFWYGTKSKQTVSLVACGSKDLHKTTTARFLSLLWPSLSTGRRVAFLTGEGTRHLSQQKKAPPR